VKQGAPLRSLAGSRSYAVISFWDEDHGDRPYCVTLEPADGEPCSYRWATDEERAFDLRSRPRIVVVVPAHNEEDGIAEALASVERQPRRADWKIVMADNCTDATEKVARAYDWTVWTSVENVHKKAGALNQAWERLEPNLDDDDYLMVMDADSVLDEHFIEGALSKHEEGNYGGVGGTFRGRPGGGLVGMLQRNEYVRYGRETRQKLGRVMVLTGTATVFKVRALRDVLQGRLKGELPRGTLSVYDTDVLTEDNELSLALQHAGYKIVSPRECTLTTEVMESWRDLARQRLRWKRGALENLFQYGLTRITLQYWYRQVLSTLGILVTAMYLLSLGISLAVTGTIRLHMIWIVVSAVFIVERVISVRRRGPLQMMLASILVVEMIFDVFLQSVHAKALWMAVTRQEKGW
jgi:cellulose synthase/poly-beta-1,6-N-acetylglucosamine synthase-like glycosyltransferase